MSVFTENEIEYLEGQRLGRLATVNGTGEPHVVPVGFRYNAELDVIDLRGRNLSRTKKFRDTGVTGRVAFVVDDVLPGEAWKARGVEVRGRAGVFSEGEKGVNGGSDAEFIRIRPTRIVGWGLDASARGPNSRRVDAR